MTRLRKIGPQTTQTAKRRRRNPGAAKILRGTDGRPVRARRTAEPAGPGVHLLRFGAVLLAAAFFGVVWTRPVQEIEVRGVWLSSPEFITQMLGSELGRRWVTTPTRDFEVQIARDPWIDEVQVLRAPGSRLLVKIREAEPVFCVDFGGARRLLDRDGDVLPECDDLYVEGLPVARGLAMVDSGLDEESASRYHEILAALDSTGWVWSEGLALIDLGDPDEVLLVSRDQTEVVVTLADAEGQLGAAATVWSELGASEPRRIDLRFENQIVLSH